MLPSPLWWSASRTPTKTSSMTSVAALDYVRLYSFLAQILPFSDVGLEKLHAFARHLRRLLPHAGEELPREIQQNIDMESYRIQQTGSGNVALDRKGKSGALEPVATKEPREVTPEELEALSRIIADLNERFGIELGPEHRVTLGRMMERLEEDAALDAARGSTRWRMCVSPSTTRSRRSSQGDRRPELRPLQADHRRSVLRRGVQEPPIRPVPPPRIDVATPRVHNEQSSCLRIQQCPHTADNAE